MIIVYTLPDCVQCDSTKRFLDKNNILYSTVDLSTDQVAKDYVLSLGYMSAPVVVSGETHWSGFRMDKLNNLIS